jgi:hypothetical protein
MWYNSSIHPYLSKTTLNMKRLPTDKKNQSICLPDLFPLPHSPDTRAIPAHRWSNPLPTEQSLPTRQLAPVYAQSTASLAGMGSLVEDGVAAVWCGHWGEVFEDDFFKLSDQELVEAAKKVCEYLFKYSTATLHRWSATFMLRMMAASRQ